MAASARRSTRRVGRAMTPALFTGSGLTGRDTALRDGARAVSTP
ncbi:MAG TPA: hypothetical protein VIG88_10645 [Lysobacter sp.]